MQELKAQKPIESPAGTDPVLRLISRLAEEGFTTEQGPEWWDEYGEIIYRRAEKLPMTSGETIFIFTRIPEVNERILRQTSEAVVQAYTAKSIAQKALTVLQSTTVYHCLVSSSDEPHNESLTEYITRSGGATFIPVVIVPDLGKQFNEQSLTSPVLLDRGEVQRISFRRRASGLSRAGQGSRRQHLC